MKRLLFLDNSVDIPSTPCHARLQAILGPRYDIELIYHHIPTQGVDGLSFKEISAIISLGSATNVGDGTPWHEPLAQFLDQALAQDIAVLGICFTHQLMAHRWGAQVVAVTPKLEVQEGARSVSATPWGPFTWIISHCYHVINPPEVLISYGATSLVPHEILCHRSLPYWSVQAHPEASDDFVASLDYKPVPTDQAAAMHDGVRFIELFLQEVAGLKVRA